MTKRTKAPETPDPTTPAEPPQAREPKDLRFQRVAGRRVNAVLRTIRVLARCANRASYAYTSDEVDVMLAAIEEAVVDLRRRFTQDRNQQEFRFR